MKVPLAYIIRKTTMVQFYGNHPKYATPEDKMIVRMLHLPPDRNKLYNKQSAHSVAEHTAEYNIDNRSFYEVMDRICKETDLYPCVKKH